MKDLRADLAVNTSFVRHEKPFSGRALSARGERPEDRVQGAAFVYFVLNELAGAAAMLAERCINHPAEHRSGFSQLLVGSPRRYTGRLLSPARGPAI